MDTNDIASLQDIAAAYEAIVEAAKTIISNTADNGVADAANCVITSASSALEELSEYVSDDDEVDFEGNDDDVNNIATNNQGDPTDAFADDDDRSTDAVAKVWAGSNLTPKTYTI